MNKSLFSKGGLWRNWVGNQSCITGYKGMPESESQLSEMIYEANKMDLKVRCAGSGHSFTSVVPTSGVLLSLQNMSGLIDIDHSNNLVKVHAGTSINAVGKALKENGMSMINQGDIDSQAIAGALTTGTHGTGLALKNLASSIKAMTIVKSDGELLEIDESNIDLLKAARVSVGTLGVISNLTLQVQKSYNLKEKIWREDFETCMEVHDELAKKYRHFGLFWCPTEKSRHYYCLPDTSKTSKTGNLKDVCEIKVMDITEDEPMTSEFEKVAYSSEIYPIDYIPNFHELEYAVPVENAKDAFREVRELILKKYPHCEYPLEYRFTAGDDAWLSPFYQQDSVTISVSGEPGTDYWPFLQDVDLILRKYNSRPHWGKLHFLEYDDVTNLYPKANDFRSLRRELDPKDMFLNDHLSGLLK